MGLQRNVIPGIYSLALMDFALVPNRIKSCMTLRVGGVWRGLGKIVERTLMGNRRGRCRFILVVVRMLFVMMGTVFVRKGSLGRFMGLV